MAERACLFGTYAREHSATRLLRAALDAAGYDVVECHVPLWERTRDKLAGFFRGASLARHGVEYARALPRLVARWRAVGKDARVVVVGFNGQLDLLIARRLIRSRIPTVFAPLVTVSETLVEDRQIYRPGSIGARLARWLDRATLGAADLVIADTEAHRTYMSETFGIARARIGTLYLGAEPAFYDPLPAGAGRASSVLFYGQYMPLHGLTAVVDAARRLAGRLAITLVGTGPERPAIEAAARDLPNLRFVDWVPYPELPSWIGKADLCLGIFGTSPKAARVIPNKVYQCAAGGRAVVTGDTPGVREIFRHGESAWLIPPGDGQALAEALAMLAADGARRAAVAASARALMRERFEPERQGHRLRRLIAEMGERGGVDRGATARA
jgi:glycosyltransferase involved in cell wall biosynthesis